MADLREVRAIKYYGSPYEPVFREALSGVACTLCLTVIEGGGVDVGPVDDLCVSCGEAVHDAIEKRDHPERFTGYEPAPAPEPEPPAPVEPEPSAPDVTEVVKKDASAKKAR